MQLNKLAAKSDRYRLLRNHLLKYKWNDISIHFKKGLNFCRNQSMKSGKYIFTFKIFTKEYRPVFLYRSARSVCWLIDVNAEQITALFIHLRIVVYMRSFVFANKHYGGTPMAFHKGVQGIPSTAQRRQIGITMGAIGEGLK